MARLADLIRRPFLAGIILDPLLIFSTSKAPAWSATRGSVSGDGSVQSHRARHEALPWDAGLLWTGYSTSFQLVSPGLIEVQREVPPANGGSLALTPYRRLDIQRARLGLPYPQWDRSQCAKQTEVHHFHTVS